MNQGQSFVTYLSACRDEMIAFTQQLALAESPSTDSTAQAMPLSMMWDQLDSIGYQVELLAGERTGGQLVAHPRQLEAGQPRQLLLGHCDTVWPLGTLRTMPVRLEDGMLRGPGVYDMKAGLTQIVFALRALHALAIEPQVAPVVFVNSDEEIGSIESAEHIHRLAPQMNRAFVLEPSLGLSGKLKTARKGVGRFQITVHGRAAHAGLDPEKGVSAILELSHVIQKLFALNDSGRGISVNVGIIEGGTRSNVIAAESQAIVDVRVPTQADADEIEVAIRALQPETPGTHLEISGSMGRPPLERTPGNRALWRLAQEAARAIDLPLDEGVAGGGSDGNYTSLYTATLDGLGAVGDGAHADHEFIFVDSLVERAALLAALLTAPPLPQ